MKQSKITAIIRLNSNVDSGFITNLCCTSIHTEGEYMNIRDIARIANVTPGTVSKVLNNYSDISEATRQKVLRVIEEYQYTPVSNSRSISSFSANKKLNIGLIIEGVYNNTHAEMEDIISIRFHNAGYTIMSFHDNYYSQDKIEKFEELIEYAMEHSLSGMVYLGGNFENISKHMFQKLPCPTIFVNTVLPTAIYETNYSSVQCNHLEASEMQMNQLIKNGHKNIAILISSLADNSVYGLRLKGYKFALSNAGLEHNLNHIIEGDYIYSKSYQNVKAYLEQHPEITAVCCSADIMVPSVIRAIHDLSKIPGKDIEIISFDGLEILEYCIPTVSSFKQPKCEMVDNIYDLLIGLINKNRNHQHVTFKCSFVSRESCKCQ